MTPLPACDKVNPRRTQCSISGVLAPAAGNGPSTPGTGRVHINTAAYKPCAEGASPFRCRLAEFGNC
ncbi:hypothetical protein PQB35_gp65 [Ochrobactrum phage vB_OspP_OH]|uniref:Uncharacterized protein n=1 Tax=Ochrobactrum phage vB_OspP_OH TaxID=2712957 RepID=A0A6G6XXU2_9CAUD|nr:hypothetical protein PQB35_gp65 [Ochrobactrum phage vB_OspP_OH]QIG66121.1 hypothetical protein phiOH_p65 [Ochrobactrum phage vB_OspP_OH]